jgi:hypothetical protein
MPYDAKGNWVPPTAEETALQPPAWYADPVNYVQVGPGLARAAGAKISSLSPQAAALPPIQGPMPLGLAGKVKEALPQEVKDIVAGASRVGEKLGIGGGKFLDKSLAVGAQKPITTIAAAAQGILPKNDLPQEKKSPAEPDPFGGKTPEVKPLPGDVAEGTGPKTSQGKPHPAAGTKDLWDYASKLSPEKLKEFVNKNQGKEGFIGVGYAETKDPDTGKMRIEPVITRPETPGMTAKERTAEAHYQQAIGTRETAKELGLSRVEAEKNRSEDKRAAQRLKEEESYFKKYAAHESNPLSDKQDDEPNLTQTFLKMWQSGEKIPERFKPGVDRAAAGFDRWFKEKAAAGKRPDTPKEREDALRVYYRLQTKYQPVKPAK